MAPMNPWMRAIGGSFCLPIPFKLGSDTPKEMDREDMDRVRDDFVAAAQRADEAGFDMIELHMAHGYC